MNTPPSIPDLNLQPPVTGERREESAANKLESHYDAGLVQRFKAGDESAFTEIIQRHYSRIRSVANRALHNQADAEEMAQDTFIRAHRNLGNFRGECTLAAWLSCIALNLARNRYWFNFRRHRHNTISIDKIAVDNSTLSLSGVLSDGRIGPREDAMTNDFVDLIAECMARLDAPHREILTMRTKLNLSYEEIAAKLAVNVGTVKSRIARARERLREVLRHRAPEFGREPGANDIFEPSRPMPDFRLAVA